MWNRMILRWILAAGLCLYLVPAALAASPQEEAAAARLREQGVLVGGETGELHLEQELSRAELAAPDQAAWPGRRRPPILYLGLLSRRCPGLGQGLRRLLHGHAADVRLWRPVVRRRGPCDGRSGLHGGAATLRMERRGRPGLEPSNCGRLCAESGAPLPRRDNRDGYSWGNGFTAGSGGELGSSYGQ